jgi:peptidoglycan/LPS O-acetylase OafA/YrhL/lysophospholipase L1-like esterase
MQTLNETTEPKPPAPPPSSEVDAPPVIPPVLPRHFPALDGIRGLAVAGVLLFHAGHLTGGYLGVDLFFVLSGFLITGLLIKEYRTKSDIRLGQFWVRRARRLMPALIALLIGVALYAALVSDPVDLSRIRADSIGTLFYVANWNTIFAGHSYWELFASPSPLEHTWSLAIEEQFYLVWPLVLWALFKFTKANLKTLLWICLGLAAISEIALQLLYSPTNSSRAYQGTDTRGVAILLGAALATALSIWGPVRGRTARMVLEIVAGTALAVLLVCWFTIDGQSEFLYRGGFLIAEIAVLILLMSAVHPETGVFSKAMSFAPLVGLGLISYGVYLYHVPIYLVLSEDRMGFGGLPLTALQIGVTIVVAIGSYYILEQPIRHKGLPKQTPARYVVPAVLVLVMGVIFFSTAAATDTADLAAEAGVSTGAGWPAAAPGAKRILFLGDSVGYSLGIESGAVAQAAGNNPAVATRALAGCSIFASEFKTRTSDAHAEGQPLDCHASWAADAAELKPDVSVVMLGGNTKNDIFKDGEWLPPCSPGWNASLKATMAQGLKDLQKNSKHVVLVNNPYYFSFNKAEGKAWVDCTNSVYNEVLKENPKIEMVDLNTWLCPEGIDGQCRQDSDQGDRLRPDGLHFKGEGGKVPAQWVLSQLPTK